MFCTKCGSQSPDDAVFCIKCGTKLKVPTIPTQTAEPKEFKCSSCGAPITPKLGEMVVSCEYCGASVSLETDGWQSIEKHSMLPITISDQDQITARLHKMIDTGLLHRHLQENSKLEELDLTMVPYWIVPISAKTNLVATDIAVAVGSIAASAAMAGVLGGAMSGGSRRGYGGGMMSGMLFGTMMGGGMGGGNNALRAYTIDANYNCPVIAVKSLTSYQPHDYEFPLDQKMDFDPKKIPKSVKILNGDINEDAAKSQAKNLVDQIQSQHAHAKYHMIRQIDTQEDVSDGELLHVPIWFAQYDHKGKKIILVVDANSGNTINSIGL